MSNPGAFQGSDAAFAESVLQRPAVERGLSSLGAGDVNATIQTHALANSLAQTNDPMTQQAAQLGRQAFGSSDAPISRTSDTTTDKAAPVGVEKSEDSVTNLISAIAGVAINAPLAAVEILTGHAQQAASVVQKKADEAGITDAARTAQQQLSNVAGQAQPYVQPVVSTAGQVASNIAQSAQTQLNAARDPNAPPVTETLSSYAASATEGVKQLVTQASVTINSTNTSNLSQQASAAVSSASQQASAIYQATAASVSNAASGASAVLSNAGATVGLTSKSTTQEEAIGTSVPPSEQFGGSAEATFRDAKSEATLSGSSSADKTSGASFESTSAFSRTLDAHGPVAGSAPATFSNLPPQSAEYGQGEIGRTDASGLTQ